MKQQFTSSVPPTSTVCCTSALVCYPIASPTPTCAALWLQSLLASCCSTLSILLFSEIIQFSTYGLVVTTDSELYSSSYFH
ncbi:hypothetical protein GDO86_017600 [Hymenochirus boettgeri]|uniref:Uncharacterized protein n=1 Tax=Hymenochirus boettgeri TaxID=247094 RepID=A0A8T2IR10_9PIPI|nr:hypothetical protein GDO86_017600 [Hymenochirus boettgeri]